MKEPPSYEHGCTRVELHATGTAPNCKPLLRVYDCRTSAQTLVCEIELSDFLGCSQWFAEGELQHNFGMDRHDKRYAQRVKAIRKALGYSYP